MTIQNLVTTDRTKQIQEILARRQPLKEKITAVGDNLRSLVISLDTLTKQRDRLITQITEPEETDNLQQLNFQELQSQIQSQLVELDLLKNRFNRNTINIGVIGRAGQGKSRLLQSLTGLSSNEIPTGDRGHCTGVRSKILHQPETDTYGEITFHSEHSFLQEVIAPYYKELDLGQVPYSLDEFACNPLPSRPSHLTNTAVAEGKYEYLQKYHQHLPQYRHLLAKPTSIRITKDQIREYVAQDNLAGERVYHNYLAVREAKIFCTFPHPDVGQIALIDMPGLGDTGVGDESRLIETLAQDVDLVMMVRLPSPPREYWKDVDLQLYDTASKALTALSFKQWSFLILNHTDVNSPIGDNSVYCQDLERDRENKGLYFADCITANCANAEDTNQKLLDPVLNFLVENITELDRKYVSVCQEDLLQLQQKVSAELNLSRQALKQSAQNQNYFPLFIELFDKFWDKLTSGLEELLKELRAERDLENFAFQQQIKTAIAACKEDSGLPTESEIEQLRHSKGGYPNAYYEYLNEVRAHLSQHFLLLDEVLKQEINKVKTQITEILIKNGKLGNLTEAREAEFLGTIAEIIPDNLKRLKLGFETLAEFELSYRGLIQHRIRQHLDDLTPDETTLQLSPSPSAAEVLSCLTSLHSEAVYKCQNALDDLLAEPNQAAFAIVEEFLDRILRAKEVKKEWLKFLQEVYDRVWVEEFEEFGNNSKISQQWILEVERAIAFNQKDNFQF
ncbi:hypothetical protein [Myxosarcina sp. GI1]|uniref:hypothetical protein n=1 Tax=Myxosarcina sp. GI1 TaxID=1541065 RepID=UPI000567E071|nr:hypothetical protein [Myxosarcina sp. GI1]